MIPPFLTHPDPDGLDAEERKRLAALREKERDYLDNEWATAIELRDDGVAVVRPLTLARLEAAMRDYARTRRSVSWSMPRGLR